MRDIEGSVARGRFAAPGFSAALPVPDGPAVFASRPEALAISPAGTSGEATIHGVTDYGTHAIIDLDLPDGSRLKSMVPDACIWAAGQPVDLTPYIFAAYRDDVVIYRSGASGMIDRISWVGRCR